MSSIVDTVVDNLESLYKETVEAIGDVLEFAWKDVLTPVMEVAFKLLGIATDETVVSTSVITQRIFQDDNMKNVLVQMMLEKQRDGSSYSDIMFKTYMQHGATQYNSYFNNGKRNYVDFLPDVNITTVVTDPTIIKSVIDSELGINATIAQASLELPSDSQWVEWYLQENYDYHIKTNTVQYQSKSWVLMSYPYNMVTNKYDCLLYRYEDVTTIEKEITEITITNIDTLTDNKNTKVSKNVKVVGSLSGVISDTTTVISNINETIPIGTESNSTNEVIISEDTDTELYESTTLSIPTYTLSRYYIAKYYTTDPTDLKWWLLNASESPYEELNDSTVILSELDMLPVVSIRNGRVDVSPESDLERYESSRKILKTIGIDIDTVLEEVKKNPQANSLEDVFIHFAITPADDSPVISKALYDMFSFIHNDSSLITSEEDGSTFYSFTFKEDPMNMAVAWIAHPVYVKTGVIGNVGSCTHEVVKVDDSFNLICRKQMSSNTYSELVMEAISNVTIIDRGNHLGTNSSTPEREDFMIPLSYYLVKKLNPMEQAELFHRSLRITLYALEVTDLEWYETESFSRYLSVIAIAVVVMVTIISLGTATTLGAAALTLLKAALVYVGTPLALDLIYKSTDSDLIRIAATIGVIAAGSYTIGGDSFVSLLNALLVPITSIGILYEYKNNELLSKRSDFLTDAEERQQTIEDVAQQFNDKLLSVYDVARLALIEELPPDISINDYYSMALHIPSNDIYYTNSFEDMLSIEY